MAAGIYFIHLCVWFMCTKTSLQESIREIPCTSDTVCVNRDPNAECVNLPDISSGFCGCKEEYTENKQWVCELKVSGTDCTSNAECGDVPLVECRDKKCVCELGYGHYRGDNICDPVLGRPCVANGACTAYLPHTTCFSVIGVYECSCEKTYIQEDKICKKELGEPCTTDGDCVRNGICNQRTTRCYCSEGYKNYDGHCVSRSQSLQISMVTSVLPFLAMMLLKSTVLV